MAPRTQPNVQKVVAILAWFHETAKAHSVKDLEKILPRVATINSMQVKDYLQALLDDSKICVEKIGNGNWYWSFPNDEKKTKDAALSTAQDDYVKAEVTATNLQALVDQMVIARVQDEEIYLGAGGDRQKLLNKHTELNDQLEILRIELANYRTHNSAATERRTIEMQSNRLIVDKFTNQILHMETHLQHLSRGNDQDAMQDMLRTLYKDEYDEETQSLREL